MNLCTPQMRFLLTNLLECDFVYFFVLLKMRMFFPLTNARHSQSQILLDTRSTKLSQTLLNFYKLYKHSPLETSQANFWGLLQAIHWIHFSIFTKGNHPNTRWYRMTTGWKRMTTWIRINLICNIFVFDAMWFVCGRLFIPVAFDVKVMNELRNK